MKEYYQRQNYQYTNTGSLEQQLILAIHKQQQNEYSMLAQLTIYNFRSNNNYRRMSVTVSNCDQICNSPTNSSKAKMLYTFSRGDRFSRRKIIMCDKFYDTKENSPARSTTLGFGHKYDFTKDVPKSPPPNIYNLKSDFDVDKKKGFGFGCSRAQMEITGPFVETMRNRNPGPGIYQMKSSLDKNSFSLRGKNYHQDHEKIKIPGPGAYPICFQINEKGTYFLSKYKNSCVRNFKTNSIRGKNIQNKLPGPGAYDVTRTDFSPDGKYCLSTMPSTLSRKFGTSQRSNIVIKLDSPGPGNYRLPSQFGYYLARNAVRKPATEGNTRKNIKQKRQLEDEKQNRQNKQSKQNKETKQTLKQ